MMPHNDSSPSTSVHTEDRCLSRQNEGASQPDRHRGRLIFALDATASRQPTWDTACQLQADMFREAAAIGGLNVQLVYYRGSERMPGLALGVTGRAPGRADGAHRVPHGPHPDRQGPRPRQARNPSCSRCKRWSSSAMPWRRIPTSLPTTPSELGRLGVPAFMFQEGNDREVEQVFREIARLTHGAYCRFDPGAARQLAELLRAVAAYAAGGMTALAARRDAGAVKLLSQMK